MCPQVLASEAPSIIESNRPDASWPKHGRISFKKVQMKYRHDTPLVLKGITFHIDSMEKIGLWCSLFLFFMLLCVVCLVARLWHTMIVTFLPFLLFLLIRLFLFFFLTIWTMWWLSLFVVPWSYSPASPFSFSFSSLLFFSFSFWYFLLLLFLLFVHLGLIFLILLISLLPSSFSFPFSVSYQHLCTPSHNFICGWEPDRAKHLIWLQTDNMREKYYWQCQVYHVKEFLFIFCSYHLCPWDTPFAINPLSSFLYSHYNFLSSLTLNPILSIICSCSLNILSF